MEDIQFEEMRSQIAILKSKLEKQEIVNDSILRDSMQMKVNNINKRAYKVIFGAFACMPLFILIHYSSHISWPVIIGSILILLCSAIGTYLIHHDVMKSGFMNGNVAEVSKALVKMKCQYTNWTKYAISPTIILMGWYTYDFVTQMGYQGTILMIMLVCCVICGFIGAYAGISRNKKTIRECDEILSQLVSKDGEATCNADASLSSKFDSIEFQVRTMFTRGFISMFVFAILAFATFHMPASFALAAILATGLVALAHIILCRDMVNGNTLCQSGSELRETTSNFKSNFKIASLLDFLVSVSLAGCVAFIISVIQPLPMSLILAAFAGLVVLAAVLNRNTYNKVKSLCDEIIEQLG